MQRAVWRWWSRWPWPALVIGSMFFLPQADQPIRTIMQHMGEVESADFTGRIPLDRNDELSDLTERLNQKSRAGTPIQKQAYLSKIKRHRGGAGTR